MKTYEQFIEDRKDPKYKDGKLPCIVCGTKDAYLVQMKIRFLRYVI